MPNGTEEVPEKKPEIKTGSTILNIKADYNVTADGSVVFNAVNLLSEKEAADEKLSTA